MIKKFILLFTSLTVLILSSCTISKAAEPERSITVTCRASVAVKADIISLDFLVRNIEWNIVNATNKNAETTNRVIEALKSAGIDENDITTVDYNVSQDLKTYSYPGQYTVVNTIRVLIRNVEIASNVIDTAIRNGSNGLCNYKYLSLDKSSALRQARSQAIQNAQDAANLLAGASGSKVGIVMEINETWASDVRDSSISNAKGVLLASAASTPILDGYVEVQSNVIVRYSLE